MAATNAINLYITTCRYVIQSNPYDPETWTDLCRYLPYLRQNLSCCVCAHVLHIPMGPIESPCQHHVCKECIGGKRRLRPSCGWCKDYGEFVENPILRTVIQCFKKLCEYLASSAIAVNLGNSSNGGKAVLMAAIQDGRSINDDYTSPTGPQLGLFPPTLHKVGSRRVSGEEQNTHSDVDISRRDKGEGHLEHEGSGSSIKRGPLELHSKETNATKSCVNKHNTEEPHQAKRSVEGESLNNITPQSPSKLHAGNKSPKPSRERKHSGRRKRVSQSNEKVTECNGDGRTGQKEKSSSKRVNGIELGRVQCENSLYETVATEHDYNRDSVNGDNPNPALKVRIRKIEGDHDSLIKRPKHVVEPIPDTLMTLSHSDGERELDQNATPFGVNNNNDALKSEDSGEDNEKPRRKKPIPGCRCGLATPNPGKLTCCGQRCPCYSAFKGCVDCRCRGCRNPRGDKPSPNSLKAQLQQQNLTTQSFLPLNTSNPALVITPIKMERFDSSMDEDGV